MNQSQSIKKKIVVIGGGTGSIAVLSGLKKYTDIELSVIVSMTDDGGSNAVIRDQFGLLPLSDVRKSIIALANTDQEMLRQLFTYRFDRGEGIKGHTLGNLMMLALSDISGSELGAIEATSKLFLVQGRVIPVTLQHASLVAEYDDGSIVESEHLIDEPVEDIDRKIITLSLNKKIEAYHKALEAIEEADVVIVGPGDMYTTTLANIIIPGIPEAIQKNKGRFIFISNLMTKKGQTHWMKTKDLVDEVVRYTERKPDVILVHNAGFPEGTIERYAENREFPIEDNMGDGDGYEVVRKDIVFDKTVEQEKGDTLVRSLIRHDADKLASVLYDLILQ